MSARTGVPGPRPWRTGGLVLCLLALAGCGKRADVLELRGETMGTHYSIQLSPAPDAADQARLRALIERRLRTINGQMSTYLPDSDIQRFNRSRTTAWQAVPASLASLVERARAISVETGGRYDITIGPLVELWGFGRSEARDTPPSDAAIAALLPAIGHDKLEVRHDPPALRKTVPGLAIDLSSIAKGWAVDELSRLLHEQGFGGHLVEIGGETRAAGRKADGSPWRVAIERPDAPRQEALAVLDADNRAVATSGDYRNYFEHTGQRFSHTLDPRSGRSVRHRLASVTVVADNCTDADAWATALMALGDAEAPGVAQRLALRALFVIREGEGLRVLHSPAWEQMSPKP
jgi:thiamine biosynthesis lipoprotein